ncbi:MAG: shikimate kinase [Clostridia bacterium]|nr:shikimate kinase [Clostridia bacterium]
MQLKIGLIGKNLGHSYSPQIHAMLGMPYSYTLHEVAPENLASFLQTTELDAFNVTIPYKKEIRPLLCGVSDTAARLGSVNTVIRTKNGFWGDNTDYYGFQYMVQKSGYRPNGKKALVIGSGGVSPTVCAVLEDMGATVTVITHRENVPQTLQKHPDTHMIVNTSPVGMYPNNGAAPLSLDYFPLLECVLDLIYNPFETTLLAEANTRALVTASGISMLAAQAKRAAELFTGHHLDDALCDSVVKKMIQTRRNLILIGMPGCGKSTVGKLIAEKMGRSFVDLDEEIVKECGKPIPAIFAEDGEDCFRQIEHRVLSRICAGSSLVIATGGGCITRSENYRPMAQNGILFWLKRDLHDLPIDGRPLSQQNALSDLYSVREPLYHRFADAAIENQAAPHTTADAVIRAFFEIPTALRT